MEFLAGLSYSSRWSQRHVFSRDFSSGTKSLLSSLETDPLFASIVPVDTGQGDPHRIESGRGVILRDLAL